MIQKVFPSLYVQGYTAALQDVLEVIGYIQEDLKRLKIKQNHKTYSNLVKFMIENRAILREEPDAFIRCNDKVEGNFEIWLNMERNRENVEKRLEEIRNE